MLFAYYANAVGLFLFWSFLAPFIASFVIHACCQRYFVIVFFTIIVGLVSWTLLGLLSEEGLNHNNFDAILFISGAWGLMSALAGAPFLFLRFRSSK